MTRIALTPEQFRLVEFDASRVHRIAREAAAAVDFPDDVDVTIEVDEVWPAPLDASQSDLVDGRAELWFTGGAFEDTHRGRLLDEDRARVALGVALLRAKDRLGGFADAPPDADVPERHRAIWDVYAEGRLARLEGFAVREPRRRYVYRLECGFNDVADAEYAALLAAESLTWADVGAIEARLTAADPRERTTKRTPVRRESLRR